MPDAKPGAGPLRDIERQELFARLAAQFEDCATLAAEGQQSGLNKARAAGLLHEIGDITKVAERSLALAKECLDGGQ